MESANLLVIMVDEMSAKTVGCYGHPTVKTPNIDGLAARGVRFSNAYCSSPICIPARAAFATGKYPHQTGYWDNVFAYDGRVKSWGHRLQEAGHRFTTIGKLHYVDGRAQTGIDEQILPMHLFGGGDIFGLEREDQPKRPQSAALAAEVAVGDSGYTKYDKQITALTEDWFANRLGDQGTKPWVVFTSFIAPHFPLTVPREYIALYDDLPMELSGKTLEDAGQLGAWWKQFRDGYDFDDYFRDDDHRRQALRHYYALCSFADENVGRVLAALENAGAAPHTRVLFLSDHGDNLGARGLWGKSTMYAESVNVPMILAGPDIPRGRTCTTPVSFIDMYPTVLQALDVPASPEDASRLGTSLLQIANAPDDPDREVFCEYHASCAPSAVMMLRKGRYKYIHYTGAGAELFDLEADPAEVRNLAGIAAYAPIVERFEGRLRAIVDPAVADQRAKRDQRQRLAELGGMEKNHCPGRRAPHAGPRRGTGIYRRIG